MTNVADKDVEWSEGYEVGYMNGLADATRTPVEMERELRVQVSRLFVTHGPADERHCEWTRTMAEPWASLAEVLT